MHLFSALVLELLAQSHHLPTSLVYDLQNLIVLRRRQAQLTLHPLDERSARNSQPSVSISHAARGESDRQAHYGNRDQQPAAALIRQGHCSWREAWVTAARGSPCPAGRPSRKWNPGRPGPRQKTGAARPPR